MRRLALLLAAACVACADGAPTGGERIAASTQAFTSSEALLVDFELDGKVFTRTNDSGTVRTRVEAQLLYAVGVLNGDRSVGRYERLELSSITTTPVGNDAYEVRYHAKLPVAWGRLDAVPTRYALTLPTSVVITGMETMERLAQGVEVAKTFKPFTPEEVDALLAKTAAAAAKGEYEKFKTSAQFDGTAKHPEWMG